MDISSSGRTQKTSPPISQRNGGEVAEIWVNGFSRPIIGKITGIFSVEGEDFDSMFFTVNDGNTEITVDVGTISAIGNMTAFAA